MLTLTYKEQRRLMTTILLSLRGIYRKQGKKMHLNIATGVLQLTPTEYDSMLQHRAELLAAKIAENIQKQAMVKSERAELLNGLYAHNARLNGGKYKEVNGYAVVSWDTDKLTRSRNCNTRKTVYRPRLQLLAVTVALWCLVGIAILVFWGKW